MDVKVIILWTRYILTYLWCLINWKLCYGPVQILDSYTYIAYNVYMSNIQYTIRNIPVPVDKVIRKRSKQSGRSFNRTVVDLLSLQTFGTTEITKDDNFDFLYNKNTLDESFDKAKKDISKVDKKLWR